MRKDSCGRSIRRFVAFVLPIAPRGQQAKYEECYERQLKRCACGRQSLNLADRRRTVHKESVKTSGLHEALQDQHRGHAVHRLRASLGADFIFPQQTIGLRRGQPLVPQVNGKLKTLAQLLGELRHFPGLRSFLPAHAQRVPQHNLFHLVFADGPLQPSKVGAVVLALQRLQALRRDAQRVRQAQPHGAAAVVNGQDASGNFHPPIIRGAASYLDIWPPTASFPPRLNSSCRRKPLTTISWKKSWSKKTNASSTPRCVQVRWRRLSSPSLSFWRFAMWPSSFSSRSWFLFCWLSCWSRWSTC